MRQSYVFRLLVGKFLHVLPNIGITASLFLLTCVCYDRLTALKKPMKYNQQNHKKRAYKVYTVCFILGLFISFPNTFRFTTLKIGNEYFVVSNLSYVNHPLSRILGFLRTFIRTLCIILSAVFSGMMAKLYRAQRRKQNQMVKTGKVRNNVDKMIHEKNLTLLLIAQVVLCVIGYLPLSMQLILYLLPSAGVTAKTKVLVVGEMLGLVAITWNFLFYLFLSKKFRTEFVGLVKKMFCFPCMIGHNSVIELN